MSDKEPPWVAVKDVCESHYGVSYPTAKNKIAAGTFPVNTYKIGKIHAIDRTVHEAFFRKKREDGLRQLQINHQLT